MDHVEICIPPFRVLGTPDKLPKLHSHYQSNAALFETFESPDTESPWCFFAVGRIGAEWPELVVSQTYSPAGWGADPGLLIVPETSVVFIGAGKRLLAYELLPIPRRLWEDSADCSFWRWSQYGETVLMSAELELAAWSVTGEKLWSTFVEPPWHYVARGDQLELDVMGRVVTFPLRDGPAANSRLHRT